MAVSKQQWLYLWQNKVVLPDDRIVTRTCFGITGDHNNRRNNYEGHCGHSIEFKDLWIGLYRPIKNLEDHIKAEFHDYLVTGHRNFRYEWINEEVTYNQIKSWIEWEVQDHPSIIKYDT
jgi:hypothetical protein